MIRKDARRYIGTSDRVISLEVRMKRRSFSGTHCCVEIRRSLNSCGRILGTPDFVQTWGRGYQSVKYQ